MASAVDEISSILGIPAEGVIEEDELKSPEQCQASMFAARQQLQAKTAPRQSSPGAAVKKVAAIKPQFKSSTLSKKPSSFQAPFKKSDFDSGDIKKPQNIVSPKQRASPDIPKKLSPPGLKKAKTSPMKSPKSPIKSPRRKPVVECSRNSQDTPPQSKSVVEKRDILHRTVERLKHTQELKSPIRSPPCERQLPTVSSRYHSPSLKRQRGRQVEESAPSPASSGSDEDEPIKKPSVKSPSLRSPTIRDKPSNILKSPLPKSPVIAQSSPPTKCLRTPPPSSVSPVSPTLPVQAQKTEDEIGRQKLEDFFTRKRKEFGINGNQNYQPPTPKGADRPKPLFKFTRKEESDSVSQEEKSPSHCSAKSPGKFKSTFKALGGGSEASEGKQSVKKDKGSKEKTQSAPAQQPSSDSKPSAKRKIQRAPQQPSKPSPPKPPVVKPPAKKEVKRKVETSSESSSEESDHTPAKPAPAKKALSNPGRKRRKVYSSSSSSSSDNEDQFSFNAGNESNEGLWVQCESEKCGKWRLLRGVSDPAEIASTWICSESTDPKRNKCSAPEENWNELETGYEYVYSAYSMGSLVWCKMQGFPWWPGMVDMDPDTKTFYYKSGASELPDKYHVTFFGKQPTRAWIGCKSMKVYNPDDKEDKYDQSKSSKGMREAIAMANQAAYLELLDRRNIYGFKEQMGSKVDIPQAKIKVTAGPSKGRGRPRKDSAPASKPPAKTKAKKLLEKASIRASQEMSLNPDGGEESYIPAPRDVRIKNQMNVIENIENEINQVLRECSPSPTEF